MENYEKYWLKDWLRVAFPSNRTRLALLVTSRHFYQLGLAGPLANSLSAFSSCSDFRMAIFWKLRSFKKKRKNVEVS